MNFDGKSILRFALTALLFAGVLGLSLSRDFYTSTMSSVYMSLALFSALIVLWTIRRSLTDLICSLGGGIFLALLDYWLLGFHPMIMAAFSFMGLAAFATLGTRTIWAGTEDRKFLLYGFVPAVLFAGSEWMASTLLDITERLHPKTFDLFLYSFDCSLRVQISFLAGQLLKMSPWLWRASLLFYVALPLPLALVYAARLRREKFHALEVMIAFLVTGPLGVMFYNLLPACGPVHIFGAGFPWHPPALADVMRMKAIPVIVSGARNAIPSLHMTWVLLIWWNSKELPRWVRAIALAFVAFTVLATLGTGEHYFVDLVVAFPFSLLVQALCSYTLPLRSGQRRVAVLFGTFVTLAWMMLLSYATSFFWISPLIPWAMVAGTVAASIFFWHRLLVAKTPQPLPARAMGAAAGVTP
jgi:PAP2 superfamily